jgi:hypothetical protein
LEASKRRVITLEREEIQQKIALSLLQTSLSNEEIAKHTDLHTKQIVRLRTLKDLINV